jgi:hypothetical protein
MKKKKEKKNTQYALDEFSSVLEQYMPALYWSSITSHRHLILGFTRRVSPILYLLRLSQAIDPLPNADHMFLSTSVNTWKHITQVSSLSTTTCIRCRSSYPSVYSRPLHYLENLSFRPFPSTCRTFAMPIVSTPLGGTRRFQCSIPY